VRLVSTRREKGCGHQNLPTPVTGYDTVIADPEGIVAQRFGLKNGGRVVIRPDGYIGAIASLDDTTAITDYFVRIGS
jgi:hypothetical protein